MEYLEMNKEIFEMQARVCKVLANPKRLEILCTLEDGELAVSEIVTKTEIGKANLSQHLSLMKEAGILNSRREGQRIYYRIANPKVTTACSLMKEVLIERIEFRNKLVG
jgi:ArsR family transcriptional regulator, virulence genes transcriptional regulator